VIPETAPDFSQPRTYEASDPSSFQQTLEYLQYDQECRPRTAFASVEHEQKRINPEDIEIDIMYFAKRRYRSDSIIEKDIRKVLYRDRFVVFYDEDVCSPNQKFGWASVEDFCKWTGGPVISFIPADPDQATVISPDYLKRLCPPLSGL